MVGGHLGAACQILASAPTFSGKEAAIDDDFDIEWEDEDDLIDEEEPDGDPSAEPTFRATIAGTRMTLLHWMNQMWVMGPNRALVERRGEDGVSVVDLYVAGERPDRELIVKFHAVGDRRTAERVLSRWARTTGYRRIWFPDRVEHLGSDLPTLGRARTACNACAAPWSDEGPDFWRMVHGCGHFPMMCPLCGGDLPQWTVIARRRNAARGGTTGAGRRSVSPSAHTRRPR